MTKKEQIDEMLKHFKPRFGNQEDIDFAKMVGQMNSLRESVEKHTSKVQRLERAVARKSADEKRLEELESRVEYRLKAILSTN